MAQYDDADRNLEGWDEYRRLVLASLESLDLGLKALGLKMDGIIDTVTNRVSQLELRINTLETRASASGAVAGFLMAVIVQAIFTFLKH